MEKKRVSAIGGMPEGVSYLLTDPLRVSSHCNTWPFVTMVIVYPLVDSSFLFCNV
ncbi:hypothetical protein COCCADRAFT_107005 [Bipolaris zeicola 26-R-13]|uniref:Uncharacterized protein n=1 Tax=Cochliobolus carbonum (strain 26-R-13) TaxID=930089 RepID=W6XVN6_COCC2|nr:uncharacterized protein COCCADRAFT_107005 [Bipolaris zeicola 26-R-13]EUC29250.1 hypothetical protein COCCADRAFT_107005 [Bipolaris zeicola 26-R-13]